MTEEYLIQARPAPPGQVLKATRRIGPYWIVYYGTICYGLSCSDRTGSTTRGNGQMTAISFDADVRRILDGRNFATIATIMPDGAPQASVVWVAREGDTVVFSTTTGRKKARNLARDPRISVSIFDTGNPYDSVEIRGTAELVPDDDKRLPYELSHKYLGEDPPLEEPNETRLIVRVTPEKLVRFTA